MLWKILLPQYIPNALLFLGAWLSFGVPAALKVDQVMPGSAAERAGLLPGDVLLSLRGEHSPKLIRQIILISQRQNLPLAVNRIAHVMVHQGPDSGDVVSFKNQALDADMNNLEVEAIEQLDMTLTPDANTVPSIFGTQEIGFALHIILIWNAKRFVNLFQTEALPEAVLS